jgi:integrase
VISRRYSKRDKRHYWGFDIRLGGTRIRDFVYDDRESAERVMLNLKYGPRRERTANRPNTEQEPHLLSHLIQSRLTNCKDIKERIRSERVLTTLVKIIGRGEQCLITEVTYKHLKEYVTLRKSEGLQDSSINRELNIISATLRRASTEFEDLGGFIPPRMPRPPKSKARREKIISSDETNKLLSWLRRPKDTNERDHRKVVARLRVADIVEFALLSGLRHGEIRHLQWTDLDLDGKSFRVFATKTQTSRTLPLTDRILAIFNRQLRKGPYIFGQGVNLHMKFYRILRRACEATGIEYGSESRTGFVLHSARHTFVTRLLQAGVDLATVQSLSGHSDRTMALHYAHATDKSKLEAMKHLE